MPDIAQTAASDRLRTLKQRILNWANEIVDPQLKDFVFHCLRHAPPAFWEMPASATGRHHPSDERGPGGLLIHILRLLSVTDDAMQWLKAAGYSERKWRDWWIATSILHDLLRATERYKKRHGPEMAKRIEARLDSRYRQLADAIRRHEGPWSDGGPSTRNWFGLLFHMADFWLTREKVKTDIEEK
ncbi:MAG: hypothetical protein JRD89_00325 [Deltaproteobacteria bacterium]|nr:hypothetical protein [Deltaproteobacteria bacterium]